MSNKLFVFISFVLICFLFPKHLSAQAPGYVGKRLFATINLSSAIAFNGPTKNNNGMEYLDSPTLEHKRGWGIDYELEASLNYVVQRLNTIDLTFGSYTTGLKAYFPTGRYNTFSQLKVRSIGIHYSFYNSRKGAIAPLGNSFSLGFKRSFVSAELIDAPGAIQNFNDVNVDDKLAYNIFSMKWSNNQVYWDKVIFRTGIRFNFLLKSPFAPLFDAYSEETDIASERNQVSYQSEVVNRLARNEFIRFDIGIGFLIY